MYFFYISRGEGIYGSMLSVSISYEKAMFNFIGIDFSSYGKKVKYHHELYGPTQDQNRLQEIADQVEGLSLNELAEWLKAHQQIRFDRWESKFGGWVEAHDWQDLIDRYQRQMK